MQNNLFSSLERSYLIAEIGVNHNGNINLAYQMISAAKESGADAVKFQTYTTGLLVGRGTPKVKYQALAGGAKETHFEMLERLELDRDDHTHLRNYCDKINIDFLSTPYDIESAKFLYDLGVKFFKTASADIVDLPLQKFIAQSGKPAIIATGMSGLAEIERVVDIYLEHHNREIALLHCVSNYPCSYESINLKAMCTLEKAFNFPVGYSDHSEGSIAAISAVAMGAKIIEKHFTLDKNLNGPDHAASSTPREFKEMVDAIRCAELIFGSPHKSCQPEERQMLEVSRKSIHTTKSIQKGQPIALDDLCLMRPGLGLNASYINHLVGRIARTDLLAGQMISLGDVKI